MSYNDIVLQVREYLERNLDANEIAHRMHINIRFVESVIISLNK